MHARRRNYHLRRGTRGYHRIGEVVRLAGLDQQAEIIGDLEPPTKAHQREPAGGLMVGGRQPDEAALVPERQQVELGGTAQLRPPGVLPGMGQEDVVLRRPILGSDLIKWTPNELSRARPSILDPVCVRVAIPGFSPAA